MIDASRKTLTFEQNTKFHPSRPAPIIQMPVKRSFYFKQNEAQLVYMPREGQSEISIIYSPLSITSNFFWIIKSGPVSSDSCQGYFA